MLASVLNHYLNTQPGATSMQAVRLEHINITVRDIERSTRFLLAALPGWRVRGEGRMDWFGKLITWRHVGDDDFYIALQGGGEGDVMNWQSHLLGPKHVGLLVPSVDEAVSRLALAGYALDHWGGATPSRRSVYVVDPDSVQFEFVEYLCDDPAARNAYAAA
jgi:catechol 2,3-dioxygenase-like lactoylglutathione lyase family enzyme